MVCRRWKCPSPALPGVFCGFRVPHSWCVGGAHVCTCTPTAAVPGDGVRPQYNPAPLLSPHSASFCTSDTQYPERVSPSNSLLVPKRSLRTFFSHCYQDHSGRPPPIASAGLGEPCFQQGRQHVGRGLSLPTEKSPRGGKPAKERNRDGKQVCVRPQFILEGWSRV